MSAYRLFSVERTVKLMAYTMPKLLWNFQA